jgi:hypothetical protein
MLLSLFMSAQNAQFLGDYMLQSVFRDLAVSLHEHAIQLNLS